VQGQGLAGGGGDDGVTVGERARGSGGVASVQGGGVAGGVLWAAELRPGSSGGGGDGGRLPGCWVGSCGGGGGGGGGGGWCGGRGVRVWADFGGAEGGL